MPAGIIEAPAAGTGPALDTNIDAPIKAAPSPAASTRQSDRMANMLKHVKRDSVDAPPKPAAEAPKPQDDKPGAKSDLKAESDGEKDEEISRPGSPAEGATDTKVEDEAVTEKTPTQKAWKVAQHLRAENAKLIKQMAELQKARPISDDLEKKTLVERVETYQKELESLRKRQKETDDLLRFRDYQNTPEFTEKYVKPHDEAQANANKRLKGMKYLDQTGVEQEMTPADIDSLAALDYPEAREAIDKLFPDPKHYNQVLTHIELLHDLKEKRNAALQKGWVDSEKWQKEQQSKQQEAQETTSRRFKSVQDENSAMFKKFDEAHRSEVEHLQEKENDNEWNAVLKKSQGDVDEALRKNPNNPDLNAAEREKMIERNTRIKNLAIAAPVLHLQVTRLKAELAKEKKTVAGYQGSQPVAGNGKGRTAAPVAMDPSDARMARIMKHVG